MTGSSDAHIVAICARLSADQITMISFLADKRIILFEALYTGRARHGDEIASILENKDW